MGGNRGRQSNKKDNIQPRGDLKAQLVKIPNPINFTESLENLRGTIQNLEFYITELQNRLTFLDESFKQLECIRLSSGSHTTYVSEPKTPEEVDFLLKNNKESIQQIAQNGGNVVFPRKSSKNSVCGSISKLEPKISQAPVYENDKILHTKKVKNQEHFDSDSSISSSGSKIYAPLRPAPRRKNVQRTSMVTHQGSANEENPTKTVELPKQKVGQKVNPIRSKNPKPELFTFEQFLEKVVKNMNQK